MPYPSYDEPEKWNKGRKCRENMMIWGGIISGEVVGPRGDLHAPKMTA